MWQHFDYEYLPYPLQVRPTSPTTEEYLEERAAAIDQAIDTLSGWYAPALEALTNPEVRVEMYGVWDQSLFRAHVGVRGEIACIATQAPGRDDEVGGEVALRAVRAGDVGRALASTLSVKPSNPLREWRFASARNDADEQARRREMRAVMAKGAVAVLPVGVHPGPGIDWRPTPDTQTLEIMCRRSRNSPGVSVTDFPMFGCAGLRVAGVVG
ncbi:ESX secretion-associated protein EspG [Gordonia bronchialis]|uniref:ESX secretion-associated protein EspG n=1 Tax=Gordonia bronchialis TaxID=2054 RepID=UPI001CBD71EC|nr:ESX secretion-associated protein EspG [Gordonia bronchialis]